LRRRSSTRRGGRSAAPRRRRPTPRRGSRRRRARRPRGRRFIGPTGRTGQTAAFTRTPCFAYASANTRDRTAPPRRPVFGSSRCCLYDDNVDDPPHPAWPCWSRQPIALIGAITFGSRRPEPRRDLVEGCFDAGVVDQDIELAEARWRRRRCDRRRLAR
jgi:hypothetical protein